MISRRFTLRLALAVCFLGLVNACASVPSTSSGAVAEDESRATALATRFDALRRDQRIPGLSVVILRDTKVVLARGLGLADVEREVPVTPDTPFDIASVSKPISAVVALRLAQDGLLDLNVPMRRPTRALPSTATRPAPREASSSATTAARGTASRCGTSFR